MTKVVEVVQLLPAAPALYCQYVSVLVADGAVQVVVTDDLYGERVESFRAELLDLCDTCVGELTVDVSACTELPPAALAVLDLARQRCALGRCVLRVVATDPLIAETISGLGIAVLK